MNAADNTAAKAFSVEEWSTLGNFEPQTLSRKVTLVVWEYNQRVSCAMKSYPENK